MSTTSDILSATTAAETQESSSSSSLSLPGNDEPQKYRGKIPGLPKAQRDQINKLLQDGCTLEKAANIMNAEHGLDLNKVNVHNWFKSGYQDYLRHQEFLYELRTVREGSGDVLNQNEILKLHQVANQLSVLQIFKTLRDDDLKDDHVNRIRSMNALSRLSREALVFKKYEDALAKELREQQQREQDLALKHNLANVQSKEELDRQLLDKTDDFFGFKSAARIRQEWAAAEGSHSAICNLPSAIVTPAAPGPATITPASQALDTAVISAPGSSESNSAPIAAPTQTPIENPQSTKIENTNESRQGLASRPVGVLGSGSAVPLSAQPPSHPTADQSAICNLPSAIELDAPVPKQPSPATLAPAPLAPDAPLPSDAPLSPVPENTLPISSGIPVNSPESGVKNSAQSEIENGREAELRLAFENFIHPDLLNCADCHAALPPLLPNGERPNPFCPNCWTPLRPPATLHLYCPACRDSIRQIWQDDTHRTSDMCPICCAALPPVALVLKKPSPPQPAPEPARVAA
jgi:hypothetical protein